MAPRTRHIRLGTGVVSAAYHHPLWVAERAVLLDHLTRGRFMLGLGPGALPTDAAMIGLEMPRTRELLEDATDVIVRLLRSDEPVTFEHDRWTLRDARLHLRPYTNPHMEVAIAAVASPSGPRLAGRHGLGLLSIGATMAAGFDLLAHHWSVMEERAAHYGATVDRQAWRLVGVMHLAETTAGSVRTCSSPTTGRPPTGSGAASNCSPAMSCRNSRGRPTAQAAARAQAVRPEMAGSNVAAVAASIEKYQAELEENG